MKKRVDQILVELNLIESRSKAQACIEEGLVLYQNQKLTKPSEKISTPVYKSEFVIHSGQANRYVSRGGTKLEGALITVDLNVENLTVLDVGMSTGGFTDCLIQRGVRQVVGVDVGTGQVHPVIQKHQSVISLENTHIKNVTNSFLQQKNLPTQFDLVVVDLSFISLDKVISHVIPLLKPRGLLLSLVKPQFELSRAALNKKGVVKADSSYKMVEDKIRNIIETLGLKVHKYFESSIVGGDGNREFFIYAQKN